MDEQEFLAQQFERHRAHLRAVAYRMLGSLTEADDTVQETWLRLSRSDTTEIDNLRGWLTTVVGRVCLDVLRSRKSRHEESFDAQLTEPIVTGAEGLNPEQEAQMAESVGIALLVVLQKLTPAERLAFVLHDMFAVPFDEIATIVGRSEDAARQLASRARRRVQGASENVEADLSQQREVVNAFLTAVRNGDFEALITVLDPDLVIRGGGAAVPQGAPTLVRGVEAGARAALAFSHAAALSQPAIINGSVGIVFAPQGRLRRVLSFTIAHGKILEIEVIADPDRLRQLDLTVLDASR